VVLGIFTPLLLLLLLLPPLTIAIFLGKYIYCLAAQMTTMPSIQPLKHVPGSAIDFGVAIDNVDLENLTGITVSTS
jgi:hypothetical protein